MRMMADENRGEFRHDGMVAIETIAAVIEAWGRGEITMPPVDPKTRADAIYHVFPGGNTYTRSRYPRVPRREHIHPRNRRPLPEVDEGERAGESELRDRLPGVPGVMSHPDLHQVLLDRVDRSGDTLIAGHRQLVLPTPLDRHLR